jgi:hypothetical protein
MTGHLTTPTRRPAALSRALLVGAIAIGALGVSPSAGADSTDDTEAGACPAQQLEQPFRALLDFNWYFLAPNGGFEDGLSSWSVTSGARVASGANQTLLPQGDGGGHVLSLPPLSSATTSLCVEGTAPTMRIFARSTSILPAVVAVTVVARRPGSLPQVLTTPNVSLLGGWGAPSALFRLPWIGDEHTDVTVTISSVGLSTVQIDDVFIDPLRQR